MTSFRPKPHMLKNTLLLHLLQKPNHHANMQGLSAISGARFRAICKDLGDRVCSAPFRLVTEGSDIRM